VIALAHERNPLSAAQVLARGCSLSWRVTDSGGTWLELLVTSRTATGSLTRSVVLVEELDSGWWIPGGCELSQTDSDELLADVARWACGAPHCRFFEQEIA
jgi:hypothetical protein